MSGHEAGRVVPITEEGLVSRPDGRDRLVRCIRSAGVCGVRLLDQALRCCLGIREFSNRADCVLRVSVVRRRSTFELAEGAVLTPGDRILELHFWNEHLAYCPNGDEPQEIFGWALCLQRRLRTSLMLLADRAVLLEDLHKYQAVHACLVVPPKNVDRAMKRLGFETSYPERSTSQQVHDHLKGILIGMLAWAYNPHGVRRVKQSSTVVELWMSKSQFERLYSCRFGVWD